MIALVKTLETVKLQAQPNQADPSALRQFSSCRTGPWRQSYTLQTRSGDAPTLCAPSRATVHTMPCQETTRAASGPPRPIDVPCQPYPARGTIHAAPNQAKRRLRPDRTLPGPGTVLPSSSRAERRAGTSHDDQPFRYGPNRATPPACAIPTRPSDWPCLAFPRHDDSPYHNGPSQIMMTDRASPSHAGPTPQSGTIQGDTLCPAMPGLVIGRSYLGHATPCPAARTRTDKPLPTVPALAQP